MKDFINAIEEQFVSSDKALASTMMKKFTGMKLDNSRVIREYTIYMETRDIAAELKND